MNTTVKYLLMAIAAFIGLWMAFGTLKFIVRHCRSQKPIACYQAKNLGLDLTTTDTYRSVIAS